MIHTYWGEIAEDWAGYSAAICFSHPFFGKKEITLFLDDEYDDDGEEIEELPSEIELDELAATYANFIEHLEARLADAQQKAFERYQKLYASYYENSTKSGEAPLNIDTVEKHNPYIKDINYLRISADKTIRILIHYGLDQEHGLEIKFVDGKIEAIGGIAET